MLQDPALAPYTAENFKGSDYASEILRNPQVSSDAKRQELDSLLAKLDSAIHDEVTSKQDVLLGHARQVQESDTALQRVKGTISGLTTTAQALRQEIQQPYSTVQQQVQQLSSLYKAAETLRMVNHHMKQAAKLRVVMSFDTSMDPMDLAKAAKMVWEIETSAPPQALTGIAAVDRCV